MRIVVCGYMIRHPVAGNILAYYHYLLGLHRLGHEVVYVEESGWPNSCYDPGAGAYGDDPTAGIRRVRAVMSRDGLGGVPVYFVSRETRRCYGGDFRDAQEKLKNADLLLNIGGVCWLPEFLSCRRRALIDMDPFFTQVGRFAQEGIGDYHAYFSYGGNIGKPTCRVPTNGIRWRPTVPPVVIDLWTTDSPPAADAPFTTVANWSAYGGVTYEGEHFGQKDEEFIKLLDLPRATNQPLELAVSGATAATIEQFRMAGWGVRDAADVSDDLGTYRRYITTSRGELSAAKNGYVKTRSGWFSDRSVCYLASGRPVIVQDTAICDWLPQSAGVQTFSTPAEAAACVARVNAAYDQHAAAAREFAARVCAHDVVLPRLLDAAVS
jgi:hypothetical protein